LRKEAGAIEKTALDWNPQGYRRRRRPKRTWRRTIEDEMRSTGRSWNEIKGIAGDCDTLQPPYSLSRFTFLSLRVSRDSKWWNSNLITTGIY
jgi:hypothetical protein